MIEKILIVDDDEQDLKAMSNIMTDLGYLNIETTLNGKDALEKAKQFLPDLLIVDTILPGINGFDVCKSVKSLDNYNPRVIVLTGNVTAIDSGQARACGADAYVVKTLDYKYLKEAVEKISSEV